MYCLVRVQIALRLESLVTLIARKRPLAVVSSHMPSQQVSNLESLATALASAGV